MAIRKTCKLFTILEKLNVEVLSFNTDFFSSERDLINIHGLMLSNFVESGIEDYLDFLKDSVKNSYLNDLFKELDFKINKSATHIIFKEDDEEFSYQSMGEYTIGDYRVFVSGSYSFIIDLYDTKKRYMYYGD